MHQRPAGQHAIAVLTERAQTAGIAVRVLVPELGDLNDDLRQHGPAALAATIRAQLAPDDVARFWRCPTPATDPPCGAGASAGDAGVTRT